MVGPLLLIILTVFTNDVNSFIFKSNKVMSESEAKEHMFAGNGGVTVVDVGLGERLIVMKKKLYTCRDLEIRASTVVCPSGYDKFEMRNIRDMCYALKYSVSEDRMGRKLCLSPNEKPSNLVMENNAMVCKSRVKGWNVSLIPEETFYRVCQKSIFDPVKVEFYAKNRDNMPFVRSGNIECGQYMCIFMMFRQLDKKFGSDSRGNGSSVSGPFPTFPGGYMPGLQPHPFNNGDYSRNRNLGSAVMNPPQPIPPPPVAPPVRPFADGSLKETDSSKSIYDDAPKSHDDAKKERPHDDESVKPGAATEEDASKKANDTEDKKEGNS